MICIIYGRVIVKTIILVLKGDAVKIIFKYKKILSLILAICLTMFSIVFVSCSSEQEPHIYVALGDSVPFGYGLAALEEAYPAVFYEMLKNENYVDEYKNMAESGATTKRLLEILNSMDKEDLRLVLNARVITVNIGGNNILVPFLEYLDNLKVKTGAEDIKTGSGKILSGIEEFIYVAINETKNASSDSSDDGLLGVLANLWGKAWDALSGLFETMSGAWKMLLGVPEAVNTFTGSFSDELKKELDEGVQAFSAEFIEIITWIEVHAPKATIVVNTVYNPIPQEVFGLSLELSNAADGYIKAMNDTIIEESKTRGYLVIDTYGNLSNQVELMNLNLDPTAGDISFDIHPNAKGHDLIAQLNYDGFVRHENAQEDK